MRKTYDFSDAKPNPYAKRLTKQVLKECPSATQRANRGSREKFEAAMERLPNAEPDDHDRL